MCCHGGTMCCHGGTMCCHGGIVCCHLYFIDFSDDVLVQTSQTLQTIKYHEMPAFGVVENLVEEEVGRSITDKGGVADRQGRGR